MKLKPGVTVENLKPQMWYAAGFIECAMLMTAGSPLTVTDTGRAPDPDSLHDDNLALDGRLKENEIPIVIQERILGFLRAKLDPLGFDTLIHGEGENRHLHCEFDPKPGERLFEEAQW